MGTGLVETPGDLGFNGGRPSHPGLLDALAVRLMEGGWRLKPIHRLIVNSAAYRQRSSVDDPRAEGLDADNRRPTWATTTPSAARPGRSTTRPTAGRSTASGPARATRRCWRRWTAPTPR